MIGKINILINLLQTNIYPTHTSIVTINVINELVDNCFFFFSMCINSIDLLSMTYSTRVQSRRLFLYQLVYYYLILFLLKAI